MIIEVLAQKYRCGCEKGMADLVSYPWNLGKT